MNQDYLVPYSANVLLVFVFGAVVTQNSSKESKETKEDIHIAQPLLILVSDLERKFHDHESLNKANHL